MMHWRGWILVGLLLCGPGVAAAEFARSYALVVGVNEYPQAGLPALPNAANDAFHTLAQFG